jgi:hypothetical protein
MEFRLLDFVDRMAHRAAKRLAVTVNFAEGVITARLRTRQHPVEPFETIELALQRLRRHVVGSQPRFVERSLDFFSSGFVPGCPFLGDLFRVVKRDLWPITKVI